GLLAGERTKPVQGQCLARSPGGRCPAKSIVLPGAPGRLGDSDLFCRSVQAGSTSWILLIPPWAGLARKGCLRVTFFLFCRYCLTGLSRRELRKPSAGGLPQERREEPHRRPRG